MLSTHRQKEGQLDIRCGLLEDLPSAIFNLWMVFCKGMRGEFSSTQFVTLVISVVGLVQVVVTMMELKDMFTTEETTDIGLQRDRADNTGQAHDPYGHEETM